MRVGIGGPSQCPSVYVIRSSYLLFNKMAPKKNGITLKQQYALKTLGFKNVNQFVKNMGTKERSKDRKANMSTLTKETNATVPNNRTRQRAESVSPNEHYKKKLKATIDSDACSDSESDDDTDEKMDTNVNTTKTTQSDNKYRKKNQKPLREGEILIKIVNNSSDSPISACKQGSVSLIKSTLKALGIAEIPDMGMVQINSKEKWATMTLLSTGPGLKTETTINKLEKGPLDLSTIEGNTQALWTLTKLHKASTGLIKNIDKEENIRDLEDYIKNANPEVKSIRRLGRSWNVAVQFNCSEQPAVLDTPFGPRKVVEYVRGPSQCMKCFKYGHTTSRCDLQSEKCAKCGEERHKIETCQNEQKCALCGDSGHNVWSKECPKKQEVKEKKDDEILKARAWEEKREQRKTTKFVYDRADFPGLNTDPLDVNCGTSGQTGAKAATNQSLQLDRMKNMVEEVRLDFKTQIQTLQDTIDTLVQTVQTCMESLNTTITTLSITFQQTLQNTETRKGEEFTVLQQSIDKLGSTIQQWSDRSWSSKPFGTPPLRKNSNLKTS